jgi:hypothetical protein
MTTSVERLPDMRTSRNEQNTSPLSALGDSLRAALTGKKPIPFFMPSATNGAGYDFVLYNHQRDNAGPTSGESPAFTDDRGDTSERSIPR